MSAAALLFMLFSPLLSRRYSAKWQYYAWLVIIIGFIVPFRPDLNFRLFKVYIPAPFIEENISAAEGMPSISAQESLSDTQTNKNIIAAHNTDSFVRRDMSSMPLDADIIKEDMSVETNAISNIPDTLQSDIKPGYLHKIPPYAAVLLIWITGAEVTLGYNLFRHYRLMLMIKRWKEDVTDTRMLDILQKQKEMLGIKKNIPVQLCPLITGSILVGFIKPVILLQSACYSKYSDEELAFIIKHELIHFKRKDLLYKILVLIAKVIHWFNPVVYLIVRAVSSQCEKSCDDAVIGGADFSVKKRYALVIAEIAKTRSGIQTALITNFYGGKYNMKNRLLSIMDKSKKRMGIVTICIALILTVCTSLVLAANTSAPEENLIPDLPEISDIYRTDVTNEANYNIIVADTNENGEMIISTDGGKTWLTQEEYDIAYPMPVIEWWTYDDYKAWIEEQKVELDKSIGLQFWNSIQGYYEITQEKIDEIIEMYESNLEAIKHGVQMSRTIDGCSNIVIVSDCSIPMPAFTSYSTSIAFNSGEEVSIGFGAASYSELYELVKAYLNKQVAAGNLTQEAADAELAKMPSEARTIIPDNGKEPMITNQVYAEYRLEPDNQAHIDRLKQLYDVDYVKVTEGTIDGFPAYMMMYQGVPVREIWDGTTGEFFTENLGTGFLFKTPEGAVDLFPEYEDGVLVRMRKSTQEEYDERTRERLRNCYEFWKTQESGLSEYLSILSGWGIDISEFQD